MHRKEDLHGGQWAQLQPTLLHPPQVIINCVEFLAAKRHASQRRRAMRRKEDLHGGQWAQLQPTFPHPPQVIITCVEFLAATRPCAAKKIYMLDSWLSFNLPLPILLR
jgi:hypothetical protein